MSETETETVPFWGTDPNVLFQQFEFFPVKTMTYEQKLNAITRGVIVLGGASFLLTMSIRILVITIVTILAIFAIHYYEEREGMVTSAVEVTPDENPLSNRLLGRIGKQDASGDVPLVYKKLDAAPTPIKMSKQNPADIVLSDRNIAKSGAFGEPSSSNPFGNFLVSDYVNNPYKRPAPPAFNNDRILTEAKTLVAELNPGQPDISDKLFKDLGEQYVFEQSLRQFTSNPSTTLMNDQTGFADFCYGSMTSCKEGNLFACARNLPRHVS
jgi:hypothetical protein